MRESRAQGADHAGARPSPRGALLRVLAVLVGGVVSFGGLLGLALLGFGLFACGYFRGRDSSPPRPPPQEWESPSVSAPSPPPPPPPSVRACDGGAPCGDAGDVTL
ncbi:MAG TPA: hypothetical protein PLR99_12285 [Polyangiaceae bacterium]|nr:hypothetical protein [Polyangiaceae bacterium]